MLQSKVTKLGLVPFAPFTNERIYMQEFSKNGLPLHLKHWDNTVISMLEGIPWKRAWLMVDQQFVKKGEYHRRKGLHVDGYWDGHDHVHRSYEASSMNNQKLILASDVAACQAYEGNYEEMSIKKGGDATNLNIRDFKAILFEPRIAYEGDAFSLLHESLPMPFDAYRTVIRLNVSIN